MDVEGGLRFDGGRAGSAGCDGGWQVLGAMVAGGCDKEAALSGGERSAKEYARGEARGEGRQPESREIEGATVMVREDRGRRSQGCGGRS